MPVTIRLMRQGAKKMPNYLIVAVDSKSRRDGSFIERLGQYFPKEADPKKKVVANLEAIQSWTRKGAQVSETVGQLLRKLAQ